MRSLNCFFYSQWLLMTSLFKCLKAYNEFLPELNRFNFILEVCLAINLRFNESINENNYN
jgi:hypothetical protein